MKFSLKKPKATKATEEQVPAQPTAEKPKLGKPKLGLGLGKGKPKAVAPKPEKSPKVKAPKIRGAKGKTLKTAKTKKKKQSFDFKKFQAEINSLNGQNYGSAPMAVKIFILIVIFALVLIMSWFLLISKKIDEIKSAEAHQVTLLDTYKEKQSKARHLAEYEKQVEQMKVDFAELLNQLPKDTRVPELVDGINMQGNNSGIRFQDISVQPEVSQEFFIEQPIQIIGLGEYHQFGAFISGIAQLPRIITMHDFEIKNPQPSLDVMPELQLVLQTKTYRAKEVDLDAAVSTEQAQEQEGSQ